MIADEHDPAVARLRRESGAVAVRTQDEHLDRVLRTIHRRRRAQRQQRVQALAALGVVLVALAAAFVVTWRAPDEAAQAAPPAPVLEWPLRGGLAGDRDLVERAETVWRISGPDRPSGQVRAVYAGSSPNRAAGLAVVVLVSATPEGRARVAFVTTPIRAGGEPDSRRLLVRAVDTVDPGQTAVGFVAARPTGDDDEVVGSVGFALAAPGVPAVSLRSSLVDQALGAAPAAEPGTAWPLLPPGAGAWNSVIETTGAALPAAGVEDPATEPVSLVRTGAGLRAVGPSVRVGDLVAAPEGALGVVVAEDGTLDTDLTALAAVGRPRIAISEIPGSLVVREDGTTTFEPDSRPDELQPTNRVVLAADGVVVNLGRLTRSDSGWRVDRAADPASATTAVRVAAG